MESLANIDVVVQFKAKDGQMRDIKKHFIDLYVVGFPCQPFSLAGKGEGVADSNGRGAIIHYILHFIKKKEPRTFILENVDGLATQHKETLNAIIAALEAPLMSLLSPSMSAVATRDCRCHLTSICISIALSMLT